MSEDQTTNADPLKLCETINLLDCFSQQAFSQIAAVAKLTLKAMESPEPPSMDQIADVLQLIALQSEDTQNTINAEAESVGCNYIDKAHLRRWDAKRAATQGEAA